MRLTARGIPYSPRVTEAPFAVLLFIGVGGPARECLSAKAKAAAKDNALHSSDLGRSNEGDQP